MAVRHIFGMAKSNLDLTGAKRQKLELDLLRLVYAVTLKRALGDEAQGYLMVMTNEIKRIAEGWAIKYQQASAVTIGVSEHSNDELTNFIAEKIRNRSAVRASLSGGEFGSDADASVAGNACERQLLDFVQAKEGPDLDVIIGQPGFLGVRWDVYTMAHPKDA